MDVWTCLANASNAVTVLTGCAALWLFGGYKLGHRRRRKCLEKYLADIPRSAKDEGKRTVMHLIAVLKMTESQVLEAAFDSSKIDSCPAQDSKTRRANAVLLSSRNN